MDQQQRDRQIDEANEQSFPASDPPSFTPSSGVADSSKPHRKRSAGAQTSEREHDPHGTAPAEQANQDEPTAAPTAERHHTETTIERVRQGK